MVRDHKGGNRNGVWAREEGQDIAEYALMLAVIPVIVVGTEIDRLKHEYGLFQGGQ